MKWFLRISFTILTVLAVLIAITTWRIFNPPHVSDLAISDLTITEPATMDWVRTTLC